MDKLSCSICVDLLQAPVTIPCGHSFCLHCIQNYWDQDRGGEDPICPQCRQAFSPRPILVKNTVIAELVEDQRAAELSKTSDYAQDICCDFCTNPKLKAEKSCLQCLVSLCHDHVQTHHVVSALKRHKLVHPIENLGDSICPQHNEVMKLYCRTDQQSICYLCSLDQHREHTVVSAAAEVTEKLKEVALRRARIQQQIQQAETNAGLLVDALGVINSSADQALSQCEKKISDAKEYIQIRHKMEMDHVKGLQEELQQIQELKQKDQDLEKLSQTHNHIHLPNSFSSLSSVQLEPGQTNPFPATYFSSELSAAVSLAVDQIQDVTTGLWSSITLKSPGVTGATRPKTREDLLKYSCNFTFDISTKHKNVDICPDGSCSMDYFTDEEDRVRPHPERFEDYGQVLCGQTLTGRCYWEVERHGEVFIAVSYKSISRRGDESAFGNNDKSWALRCSPYAYELIHRGTRTPVADPFSSKIGVYVDHSAGIVCFYALKDQDQILFHQVQTSFSQPLCPGFGVYHGTAKLISNKATKK